eukprot:1145051-Pelagomonas_calceolata.AAC.6
MSCTGKLFGATTDEHTSLVTQEHTHTAHHAGCGLGLMTSSGEYDPCHRMYGNTAHTGITRIVAYHAQHTARTGILQIEAHYTAHSACRHHANHSAPCTAHSVHGYHANQSAPRTAMHTMQHKALTHGSAVESASRDAA